MEKCTDTFQFDNCKMFQILRDSLPENQLCTQNLLECRDDLLFGWNAKDCCLLAINWRAARLKGDAVNFQTLTPSCPQNFIIDKILASNESSLIALSGKRGVAIVELPRRQFQEGKDKIICKSFNLDEKFFAHNSHIEILQIRWHPASPTDSHLLVLLSDNTIRIYNEASLQHTWRIGPTPSNDCNFLNSLGDTAVDFDIGPARTVSWSDDMNKSRNFNESHNSSIIVNEATKVIWPIIILRGNGSVYILCAGIDSEKPRLQGPISMNPSANDNYGLDFCSILVIPTIPATVIIAENSGRLHQSLLIESDGDDETSFNEIDTSLHIYPSEWILNVLEIIELDLGLVEKSNLKNENNCPIHLKRDPIIEFRYFAYHNTGLHAITVNFIKELQTFIESDENLCEKSPSLSSPSRFEYIVCTKALNSSNINPVLGLTFLQSPSGLILFLSTGQLVTLDLITDSSFLRDFKMNSNNRDLTFNDSPVKKLLKESFDIHIRNILKSGTTQPILKLDKSVEPTPQETLELLMQAVQILREQYFTKHDKVRQELQKRVKILQQLKETQRKEIDNLQYEQENIRENAERLAEIYEDTCEKQQVLFGKSMDLVRVVTSALPVLSVSEKNYCADIKKINNYTQELMKKIQQTKKKIEDQELNISNMKKQKGKNKTTREFSLPPKQEILIKSMLADITSEIDDQIKDVEKINNFVNVS